MNIEITRQNKGKNLYNGLLTSIFPNNLFISNLIKKSSYMDAVIIGSGFLLGRASIAGGLLPFGLAIYCAAAAMSCNKIITAISVILGMLSAGGFEQVYISTAAMLLYTILSFAVPAKGKWNGFIYGLYGFLASYIPAMVMVYLQGMLIYDLLKALLQSFIVFVLVYIFKMAVKVINDFNRRQVLTTEETISFSILVALSITGFGSISLLGVGVKNVLCILMILLVGYKCGAGTGAAVGTSIGVITGLGSATTPLIMGAFGFCGLLAGIFSPVGKIGSALGFVMGNVVLSIYMGSSSIGILGEVTVAILVFFIMPQRLIDAVMGKFANTNLGVSESRDYSMRIKEITIDRLNRFSKAFGELAKTFGEIAETTTVTDKTDITGIFDRVAERVCKDCTLCTYCWDKNFYNTYQALFKIVSKLEDKGRIEAQDIPNYFMGRCERIEEFVNSANNVYELFKLDMVWKSRVGESRGMVSQQLGGLSQVIGKLASEIDMDVHMRNDIEDLLIMELTKNNIRGCEAVVYENKSGKYEVSVYHKNCSGRKECASTIEKVVASVIGRKMRRTEAECVNSGYGGRYLLRMVEEDGFCVITGIAATNKSKSQMSGDCHTFINTNDGKYIMALSDGMGSGKKAAVQSRAAINLLENFLECGFDKDTAMKLINSVLVLKSNDDSFATVDLSVIDLQKGETEFLKVGAAPTFIKREEIVEIIRTISLPAGLMSIIDTEFSVKKLDSGNFVIMVTDGIVEAFRGIEEPEFKLRDFIGEIDSLNPQYMADRILKKALELSDEAPLDDMTVLVAKMWSKST